MCGHIRVSYKYLENDPTDIRTLIGLKPCLAGAVDLMMAGANRIYILMIKVNKLFFFFPSRHFLNEIENMFSVFQSSFSTNLLAVCHKCLSLIGSATHFLWGDTNESRDQFKQIKNRSKFRLRLHGRGFQSKRFHDLETASKTTWFQRVYTEPIQPLNPTVYVKAISFSGLCASSIGSRFDQT